MSCYDIYKKAGLAAEGRPSMLTKASGIYTIILVNGKHIQVFCDMINHGATVIQR